MKKVLESAIANAEHNDGADIDELKVTSDPCRRRTLAAAFSRPRQRAAACAIEKQTCHIFLTVARQERQLSKKDREEYGTEDTSHRLPALRQP